MSTIDVNTDGVRAGVTTLDEVAAVFDRAGRQLTEAPAIEEAVGTTNAGKDFDEAWLRFRDIAVGHTDWSQGSAEDLAYLLAPTAQGFVDADESVVSTMNTAGETATYAGTRADGIV